MDGQREKSKQGFTLVELMVAIVIIGVLAALVIPRMSNYTGKTKVSEVLTVLASYERLQGTHLMSTGTVGLGSTIGFDPVAGSKYFTYDTETTAGTIEGALTITAGSCAIGTTWVSSTNSNGVIPHTGTALAIPDCIAYTSNFMGTF